MGYSSYGFLLFGVSCGDHHLGIGRDHYDIFALAVVCIRYNPVGGNFWLGLPLGLCEVG